MRRRVASAYARSVFVPTLGWNILLGRILRVRRWWDRVDEHVILGALPFSGDVPKLHAVGVRGVVNTCHEYPGPLRAYEQFGIEQLHIPTIDFTHPRLEDVQRAVEFISQHAQNQRSVYVHCKAGRGRSATVVLCYLVGARGMTPKQAQQWLLARRRHVHARLNDRPVVQSYCGALPATVPTSLLEPRLQIPN